MKYKGYLIKEVKSYWILETDETETITQFISSRCRSIEEAKEFIDEITGKGGLKHAVK